MAGRPEIVGLPRFVFGQSMGGAIALKALLKDPNEWDGIILVAPMCKVMHSKAFVLYQLELHDNLWFQTCTV